MNKSIALGLAALILMASSSQLAQAAGKMTVVNNSKFALNGSITYHTALCKDDKIYLAGSGKWSVNSGLCAVKGSSFSLTDKQGVSHVCAYGSASHTAQNFRIYHRTSIPNAFCEVTNEAPMY